MSKQILPTTPYEPEVQRCPFCGCAAMIDNWQSKTQSTEYFARCYDNARCGITGPVRATYEEARQAWNHWLVIAKMVVCPDLSGAGG